jgi:predicted ATPase
MVVLTGGPGAGKTALLELIRHCFCRHVVVIPESAGIVFGGGFPRGNLVPLKEAAQRAIFHVQRELEAVGEIGAPALLLCDRGTVDGAAFWPGTDYTPFWTSVGTTLEKELERYHAVIHLRTPPPGSGLYNHSNPLRVETEAQAAAIDEKIALLWAAHPRRFEIEATPNFLEKASRALEILRQQVPVCCRHHMLPLVDVSKMTIAEPLVAAGALDEQC